jgi:hypothetical protein
MCEPYVTAEFRKRLGREAASAIRVGWCARAAGWRWALEFPDGAVLPWSAASYRTREAAVGVAYLTLVAA